jgi:hypothetical protein
MMRMPIVNLAMLLMHRKIIMARSVHSVILRMDGRVEDLTTADLPIVDLAMRLMRL